MASPEALRRINQHEEDLRAIGDTVIDIKEIVDQHTQELVTIKHTVAQHTQELGTIKHTVTQHTQELGTIKHQLTEILTLLRGQQRG